MPITKEQARTLGRFYHTKQRNADGSAVRCRSNGKLKEWKTRPNDWRLPVKYGLKTCFYLTPRNADEWLLFDITDPADMAITAGLLVGTDPRIVRDKLIEMGLLEV